MTHLAILCVATRYLFCRQIREAADIMAFVKHLRLHFRLVVVWISVFAGPNYYRSQPLQAQDDPATLALIDQLDDRSFGKRQLATKELSKLGPSILRPLVSQCIGKGPELNWRTQHVIRNIALEGDEATFVKCVAILRTISTDERIDENLKALQTGWKAGQSDRAASSMRQAGAILNLMDANAINPLVGIAWADYAEVDESTEPTKLEKVKPRKTPLDSEATLKAVDEILAAPLKQNYSVAFPNKESDTQTSKNRELIIQQQMRQQQMLQRQIIFANNGAFGPGEFSLGNSVEFGANWKGTEEDFAKIALIDDVSTVIFRDFNIEPKHLEPLERISQLTTLKLVDVEFSEDAIKMIPGIKSIRTLEFSGQALPKGLIDALKNLPNLYSMSIEADCDVDECMDDLRRLPSLTSLHLVRMDLKDGKLKNFEKFATLSSVLLEGCTFDIVDFKEYRAHHPEMSFEFVPRAFMGVKTSLEANQNVDWPWCRIGEVVPGSGADLAGMKTGDIVKKIADQDIETFDDLRLVVAQYKPDDVVTVEVERDEEILQMKIKLGDRSKVNE